VAKSDIWRKLAFAGGVFALLCAVAFVFVQATYFFPGDLMMYVKCARMVNADHDPSYLAYLGGEFQHRFTGYFLAAYLLKEPLAGIVLALVGFVALVRSNSVPLLGKLFLVVPAAAYFAAVTVMADNVGIRYAIPVLPFVHLIAGFGIATLIQARGRFAWAPYAAAVLCGWAVLAFAGIYPDHLSYFNESACLMSQPGKIGLDGGSRCGPAWLDDSNVDWGQSFKQLKTWLDRNGGGRTVKVAGTWYPPEAYGIKYQRLDFKDVMQEPGPGLYAVSAHLVARVPNLRGASTWLQRVPPAAIVGHSLYIYDVPGR
jgi:hypothetical protein